MPNWASAQPPARTPFSCSAGTPKVPRSWASLVANASALLHIGKFPLDGYPTAPLDVTATPVADAGDVSSVQVTWESSDPLVNRWVLTVDGIPGGLVDASVRTATITDVRRTEDVEIGVIGFTEDGAADKGDSSRQERLCHQRVPGAGRSSTGSERHDGRAVGADEVQPGRRFRAEHPSGRLANLRSGHL